MKKYLIVVCALLLIACSKETEIMPQQAPKTSLRLTFYDEFAGEQLDSVTFSIVNGNKSYVLTRNNSIINDLPKGIVKARLSKKGFITQDYEVDFSKRDTINDNIVMVYDDFILDVPQDSLFATKSRKTFSFEVRRNAGFTIDKPDWIRVDTTNISKLAIKINVTVLDNSTTEIRQGETIFTNGESRRIIPVTQYRKASINEAYYTVNEVIALDLKMTDEFIGFPTVERIGGLCYSEIKYQNVEGKQIAFTNACVSLLAPMDYKIHVRNKGGLDTVDFQVKLYDKKIDLNEYREQMSNITTLGSSTHLYYLDKERKNLGIINAESFAIEKRINLPVTPKGIVYNPYNKSNYVLSTDEYLRILNLQTNEITDKILIPTDPVNDHPQSPYNIPELLTFNEDGMGFMVTVGDNISGNGFRSVNSRNNNVIEVLPQFQFKAARNSGVLPNKKDFYFNEANSNLHFTWSASTGKSTEEFGSYDIFHYKNWAVSENRLVDYESKSDLGVELSIYPAVLDTHKLRFYGWSSYYQQYYFTQLDAQGNTLARIPAYQVDFLLSPDGQFLYLYDASNADLYKISTDVFNVRRQLAVN